MGNVEGRVGGGCPDDFCQQGVPLVDPRSRAEDMEWLDTPMHLYQETYVDERYACLAGEDRGAGPGPTPPPPPPDGDRDDDDSNDGKGTIDNLLLSLAELVDDHAGENLASGGPPDTPPLDHNNDQAASTTDPPEGPPSLKREGSRWDSVGHFPDLQAGRCESEFLYAVHKRSKIYNRIHRAVIAELARARSHKSRPPQRPPTAEEEEEPPSPRGGGGTDACDDDGAQPGRTGNVMMAGAIRMVLDLASEFRQSNPAVFHGMCTTLMTLLEECSPLPLAHLPTQSIEATSMGRVQAYARLLLSEGSTSLERHHALSLLIAFAVSNGSVSDLIQVVNHLLTQPPPPPPPAPRLLDRTTVFLHQLKRQRAHLKLSMPEEEPVGHDISIKQLCHFIQPQQDYTEVGGGASLASDGRFLYLYVASTLLKVGSGQGNTEAGRVYQTSHSLSRYGAEGVLSVRAAFYGIGRDVTPFLASVRPSSPVDLRPLLDGMLNDQCDPTIRRLTMEVTSVDGTREMVVMEGSTLMWPPERLGRGDRITWAYYGVLVDATQAMKGQCDGKAQVTLRLGDLGLDGSKAGLQDQALLFIRYDYNGGLYPTSCRTSGVMELPDPSLRREASLNVLDGQLYMTVWVPGEGCEHLAIDCDTLDVVASSSSSSSTRRGEEESKGEAPACGEGPTVREQGLVPCEGIMLWSKRESGPEMAITQLREPPGLGIPWVDPRGYDGGGAIVVSYPPGPPRRVVGYMLRCSAEEDNRASDPYSWRVEGFNGRCWCVLHRVDGHIFTHRQEEAHFRIPSPRASYYYSYRIVFEAVRDPLESQALVLDGLALYEEEVSGLHSVYRTPITSDGRHLYQLHARGGKGADLVLHEKALRHSHGVVTEVLVAEHPLHASRLPALSSLPAGSIPSLLHRAALYTNGHEVILLVNQGPSPPEAGASTGEKSGKDLKLVSFNIMTGMPGAINTHLSGHKAVGRGWCYDAHNNLIWYLLPSSCHIRRWRNRDLATRTLKADAQKAWDELLGGRSPEDLVLHGSLHDVGLFMLSHLDRCSAQFDRHLSDQELKPEGEERRAFAFELRPSTFTHIMDLLKSCVRKDHGMGLSVLLPALRILRVNLYQLTRQGLGPDAFGPAESRDDLLRLVMELINAAHEEGSGKEEQLVQKEALELFITGVDIFYPTGDEQAHLVASYLRQSAAADSFRGAERSILMMLLSRLQDLSSLAGLLEGGSLEELVTVLMELGCSNTLDRLQRDATQQQEEEGAYCTLDVVTILDKIQRYLFARAMVEVEGEREVPDAVAHFLTCLISRCKGLLGEINDLPIPDGGSPIYAERALLESPVGVLLSPCLTQLWMMASTNPQSTRKVLVAIAPLLSDMTQQLSRAMKLLGQQQQLESRLDRSVTKVVTATLESEHQYGNNLHEKIKLHIPHARKMTVVFSPETATEQSYDYVRIFKDEDMVETWHPSVDKFSGTRQWPGKDLPPLEILSDTAWVLFHTDGSHVDWGWRLCATGEVQYDVTCQQLHWLAQLERVGALVGGVVVEALVQGSTTAALEATETNHGEWFDDAILSSLPTPSLLEQFLPHIDRWAPQRSQSQELSLLPEARFHHELEMPLRPSRINSPTVSKEPKLLLKQLVRSPLGPNAQILVGIMKEHVIEDRGQLPIINEAVYAAAAALISHNNLTEEVNMVVKMHRPPSAPLIKVWRVAQKMRQWLAFSDAAAAQDMCASQEHRAHHRRRPSLYSGTSDEVLDKVCTGAINRAKWLLSIQPFDEEGISQQLHHRRRTRSLCVSADMSTSWSPHLDSAISDHQPDMTTTSAALELKELLEFRRALSERRRRKKTTTELVLAFLQSDTMVEDLVKIITAREGRAAQRAQGINLARSLLTSLSSHEAKAELLSRLIKGLRSLRCVSKTWLGDRVHVMNRLQGIAAPRRQEVAKAFTALVSHLTNLLSEAGGDATTSQLVRLALHAVAMDYDPDDHEMLHDSRLLPQIHALMSSRDDGLRRTAVAIFKLLLRRCLGPTEGPHPPMASLFQHDLLNVLKLELQSVAVAQERGAALTGPVQGSHTTIDTSEGQVGALCLLGSPVEISRRSRGFFAPHTTTTSTHTLAFWLWRHSVKHRHGKTKTRYKVVGTEGCLIRATPDLDSDVVATLEMGTIVELCDPEPEHADHPLLRSGRRVRLCRPVAGYCSRHASQGYQILRQEAEVRVGDRVCRGPDWGGRGDEEDGGAGHLGSVMAVVNFERAENRGVRVRWDHDPSKTHTYRWGYLGKYDVVVTQKDESGLLVFKGNESLLSREELTGTWTSFGVGLKEDASLDHFIAAGSEVIHVGSRQKVPTDEWTHVALVGSPSSVKLYFNGRLDGEARLPKHMVRPCKPVFRTITKYVETAHPYQDNMDEYWRVVIPGASTIRISFDAQTRTEAEFDYVKIYKDSTHTETWGLEKYHGGRSNSAANWPGIQQLPLEIPADSFVVYFHSDGSNNDWGFRLIAEGTCAVYEDPSEEEMGTKEDINAFPWYFGQPPIRTTTRRTIDRGWLAGAYVCNKALNDDGVRALMVATSPDVIPPDPYPEAKTVETLAMVSHCCQTPVGRSTFSTEAMVSLFLKLVSSGPPPVRLTALKLCQVILPTVRHEVLDGYVAGESGFAQSFLRCIGQAQNVWGRHMGRGPAVAGARLAAREDLTLSLSKASILLSLMEDKAWGDHIFGMVYKYLVSLPDLVTALRHVCLSPTDEDGDLTGIRLEDLDMAMAAITMIGGVYHTYHFGSRVLYRKTTGSTTEVNEGVVLRVQLHSEGKARDPSEHDVAEEVLTVLPGDQGGLVQVESTEVMPLPSEPPPALAQRLLQAAPDLLPVFQAILRASDGGRVTAPTEAGCAISSKAWAMACLNDIHTRVMKALARLYQDDEFITAYLPLVKEVSLYALARAPHIPVEPAKKHKVFESKHPYDNNTKQTFEVNVRGAVKLSIEFDPQSRTETGCDYLVFYKDRSKRERWGMDKYSGKEQWPGCGGRPPLEIPSSSFVVYWYTDGSNTDWGYRFTVTATMAQIDVTTAPVAQLEQRLYHVNEILYELPRAQSSGGGRGVRDRAGRRW